MPRRESDEGVLREYVWGDPKAGHDLPKRTFCVAVPPDPFQEMLVSNKG
jgi:hypothetical protein